MHGLLRLTGSQALTMKYKRPGMSCTKTNFCHILQVNRFTGIHRHHQFRHFFSCRQELTSSDGYFLIRLYQRAGIMGHIT